MMNGRLARVLLTLCGMAMAVFSATAAMTSENGSPNPGECMWMRQRSPEGPLVVIVSLPAQRVFVYRNGVRIGMSPVSTGRPGFDTPSGVYTILQKHREHYSNLYDNAPMPFMQRLTWDGLALHAGSLPGYPASHGCVRLPAKFAELLYAVTAPGSIVVVAASDTFPAAVVSPGLFSPVDSMTGATPLPEGSGLYGWFPGRAPAGPLTVLLSTSDRQVVVFRNAIEIGRADIVVSGEPVTGTHAYVMLEGEQPGASVVVPERPAKRWMSLVMPSHPSSEAELRAAIKAGRLAIPREFARAVYDVLKPGASVIITDEPLESVEGDVAVMESEVQPNEAPH
jgi:hypothetical protein